MLEKCYFPSAVPVTVQRSKVKEFVLISAFVFFSGSKTKMTVKQRNRKAETWLAGLPIVHLFCASSPLMSAQSSRNIRSESTR